MDWTQIAGFVRHILTFAGGYLVAKGFIDEATMQTLAGAVTSIIGVIWSFIAKKKA